MSEKAVHQWVTGGTRAVRETAYPASGGRRVISIDCHRRIGGPYSGTSRLVRVLVPEVIERWRHLAERHKLVLCMVAPEWKDVLQDTETLTSQANLQERTRFYSDKRTERIAHGLVDFLQMLVTDEFIGPSTILFENVQDADELDQEFLRMLLRRARPERLQVVVSAAETGLSADLIRALERWTERVVAQGDVLTLTEAEQLLAGMTEDERMLLGKRYVRSDCTSDHLPEHLAYERAPQEVRARWHDERAAQWEQQEGVVGQLGAIPWHREHGSDPVGAGVDAMVKALGLCMNFGFYQAVIDFADRVRAWVGPDSEREKTYWYATLMKLKVVGGLILIEETEELCTESQMLTAHPEVHMQVSYQRAMLATRYRKERDHRMARVWCQVALAIASQLDDRKKRAFKTSFYQNALALVEMRAGNSDLALRLVEEAYELASSELMADEFEQHRSVLLYNKGQIYARQGRYVEALETYAHVIQLDPNHAEYQFDCGNFHNFLGNDEQALACYTRALELSPPFLEVYHNRGLLLKKIGQVDAAIADFSYLLELNCDDVEALEHRANLRIATQQWDEARLDVEQGLHLQPQQPQWSSMLGMIEMEQGRLEAAIAAFTTSLTVDATRVEAWTNRAVALFELGDVTGAIADLTEALALGEESTVLYNRAWAYQSIEDWEQAIADYTEALHLPDADVADIYYQRGVCHLQAGQREDALADWQKHLELAGSESPYRAEIDKK